MAIGAISGIGVGGFVFILFVTYWIWYLCCRQKQQATSTLQPPPQPVAHVSSVSVHVPAEPVAYPQARVEEEKPAAPAYPTAYPTAPPAYPAAMPVDINGDGMADRVMVDTTGDGQVDTLMTAEQHAAVRMQAAFRGQQARNQMEMMGYAPGFQPGAVQQESARRDVERGSAEWSQVSEYFSARLAPSERHRCQIQTIEKISNPDIRDAYELILKQMGRREQKRASAGRQALDAGNLEIAWVFHACGCDAGVVENIIAGGFNRSYAGKNATVYGPGSYFARDTSYSARSTYSPPDEHGVQRIFMCRLAIGSACPVDPGYDDKEPPVRDGDPMLGVGTLKHDTTTNKNFKDGLPEIMVAFKDNQAMAEYLVAFRM